MKNNYLSNLQMKYRNKNKSDVTNLKHKSVKKIALNIGKPKSLSRERHLKNKFAYKNQMMFKDNIEGGRRNTSLNQTQTSRNTKKATKRSLDRKKVIAAAHKKSPRLSLNSRQKNLTNYHSIRSTLKSNKSAQRTDSNTKTSIKNLKYMLQNTSSELSNDSSAFCAKTARDTFNQSK